MAESLRVRQKRVAREAILHATADEVAERGLEQLSLQAVADRAGVSLRTLYNYFENREALLHGLRAWSDEITLAMGGIVVPTDLEHLPEMVRALWRVWAAQGNVYAAHAKIDAALFSPEVSPERRRRRSALLEAVRTVRPDLSVDRCGELASLFHALASDPTFRRMTTEDGLDPDQASRVVAWAVAVLRDALTEGDDPYRRESEPS